MKLIGLAMINEEDDILPDTLPANARYLDSLYVLDGTADNTRSRAVCETVGCDGYTRDADLPRPPYPVSATDGYRQWLFEQATTDHGPDNLFALIHGDELWTADPRNAVDGNDGWLFPLPCFFPREPWDDEKPALAQLRWNLRPGYPEFRLFRGGPDVAYAPEQHFNVVPSGISKIGRSDTPILHYPFRSPESQHARARASFDPGNYAHIDTDTIWTDGRIESEQRHPHYRELAYT